MEMSLWTLLLLLLSFVSRGNTDECPKPVLKENLVLSDSALLKNNFPNGSVISLECAIGYEVDKGSSTITCVGGEWSHQELTCKKKDCGPPEPSPNMEFEILSGTLFGAYARPYCDRGYNLQGSTARQCLANGWTGRSTCVLVTCGKPPEIPNSVIVSDHKKEIMEFEDVIEYDCVDGYTLVGNASVVCQENGKYSSLPQCKDECPKPVLKENLVLSDSALLKNNFPNGSVISLECAIGYEVDKGSSTITCVGGEWSHQELTCKKKDCGPPKPSPNMEFEILSGTLFGAYARPYCDRGYNLQGSTARQCLANGWTGRSTCVLVTCGKPPEIPNSVIVSDRKKEIMEFEDVIEYDCEDGYTLVGNASVVCQENGKYSSLPQCKVVTCGKPPEIPNSVIVSDRKKEIMEFEDVIEYDCEDGYTLVGNASVVCQENGKYSSLPQCKVVTCGKPPEIPNSVIVSDRKKEIMEFEDVIEYDCVDGYTLVGNASVVCQENGKYSSLPQCKEIIAAPSNLTLGVSAGIGLASLCCAGIYLALNWLKKRKGSYNTGEEKIPKDPLMQGESFISY